MALANRDYCKTYYLNYASRLAIFMGLLPGRELRAFKNFSVEKNVAGIGPQIDIDRDSIGLGWLRRCAPQGACANRLKWKN
jgi:hypothetical protein